MENKHIGSTFHAKQFDRLEITPVAWVFYCPKCEAERIFAGKIKKEIRCHICDVVYSRLKLKDLPDVEKNSEGLKAIGDADTKSPKAIAFNNTIIPPDTPETGSGDTVPGNPEKN